MEYKTSLNFSQTERRIRTNYSNLMPSTRKHFGQFGSYDSTTTNGRVTHNTYIHYFNKVGLTKGSFTTKPSACSTPIRAPR